MSKIEPRLSSSARSLDRFADMAAAVSEGCGERIAALEEEVRVQALLVARLRGDLESLHREAVSLTVENRHLRWFVRRFLRDGNEILHHIGPPSHEREVPPAPGGFDDTDAALVFCRPGPGMDDTAPVAAEAVCDSPADGDGCVCRPILVPSARVPGVGPTLRVMDGAPSNFDVEGSREKS
jgi:hypothetical protein